MKNEQEWIQALLKGSKEAGEWFIREHYPAIYRLLLHITRNQDLAQDLTQQTFMSAWKAIATFRSDAHIRTWLHRIAWNEFLRWKRDNRETISLQSAELLPDPSSPDRIEALYLEQALLQLDEEHRITFLLFYVQQLSLNEVADVLGLPTGTVKSRLFNSRKRLRDILQSAEHITTGQIERKLLSSEPSLTLSSITQEVSSNEVSSHIP